LSASLSLHDFLFSTGNGGYCAQQIERTNFMPPAHDHHGLHHAGWLRAAVLGANDGIISMAGLIVGVAASGASETVILATGFAGLVAGAMSMAAGEYVSVQSQADMEDTNLHMERRSLHENPDWELQELASIYEQRGLHPELARQVAEQLTASDALAAHARDELGITEQLRARPLQAALASAAAFTVGAVLPIVAAWLAPAPRISLVVTVATLLGLFVSGALAAYTGGAQVLRGAWRVFFWGALAMAASHGIGMLFDVKV
jgi:VIT1/CCC1 family predicted Fe2+/Mn2+ transporter